MKSQESLISVDNLPEYILEYFGIIFKKSFNKIKPDYPIFPNIAHKNAKKKPNSIHKTTGYETGRGTLSDKIRCYGRGLRAS